MFQDLVVMKLISSLVFVYVGIMNEASRKLTKNVYFLSQFQEIGHLELTTLSFNYFNSQQRLFDFDDSDADMRYFQFAGHVK